MREDHLATAYRVVAGPHAGSGRAALALLRSVWSWHNETLNIWTHLLGFISWIVIAYHVKNFVVTVNSPDRRTHGLLFACLIAPTIASMLSSVLFHTFRPLSEWHYAKLASIDFAFVVIALSLTQFPQLYYTLHSNPLQQRTYCTLLVILLFIGIGYCCIPTLTHPSMRVIRTSVFALIASLSAVATLHSVVLKPFGSKTHHAAVFGLPLMVIYMPLLLAVILYIPRVPERFYPGVFDCTLQSHILFHLLAMTSQYLMLRHYINLYHRITSKSS